MAKVALCRVILESLDPVTDNAGIQFVFNNDAATDFSGIGGVFTALESFFNTVATGSLRAVGQYIGPVMSRATNASFIEVYDITTHLDGSAHGSPVAMTSFTLVNPANTTAVPEGVAATLSFRADYGTDVEFGPGTRPRARDRNRVYVGPLNLAALTTDTITSRAKLIPQFMTDCLKALFALSNSIGTEPDEWNLRVWTRVGAAIKVPTTGWMDDRPDYQRRRSDPSPATRTYEALASV